MAEVYYVPIKNRIARWLLRPLFRGIFRLISRVHINGGENIPAHGPYLVAINHISLFEAPLIVAFWPTAMEAVGAIDVWQRPGQSTLVRLYGGIPVRRKEYDRKVIDTMLAVLRSGRPLLIAPEGGRSHQPGMQRAHPGVAYVMDKANVPVVPVGIVGTTEDFLRRALHGKRPTLQMYIGAPISLPAISGSAEERRLARQLNADLVMSRIAAMLPHDYRGVYADLHVTETAG
ncbi:MAG: lysophospholipid acyltransferase family protein [Anaerolineales bacterium]|nr:lysophospholipid acyltransferase family protein [Anaerolineales bacterium]